MAALFIIMVCAAIAVPFTVAAWGMPRRQCPHCGTVIEPDPTLVRMVRPE